MSRQTIQERRIVEIFNANPRPTLGMNQQVQTLLHNAPPVELKDRDSWTEFVSANPLLEAPMTRWMQLLELEVAAGGTIERAVFATYFIADYERRLPDQLKNVVAALAKAWKYGEQLQQWYGTKRG